MAGEATKRAGYYEPVETRGIDPDRHAIDPNSPLAEAHRNGVVPDMAVPEVVDPTEPQPEPSAPTSSTPKPQPSPDEPVPQFADGGRRAIFDRIRARDTRAVKDARPNIDPESVPEGVGFEGDEAVPPQTERGGQQPSREVEAAPSREVPAAPDKFTLKVYGNTINVTREEARRYAGLEDSDEQIPDAALVRLAQKNLALDEDRERLKSQRRGDFAPPLADDHIGSPARNADAPQPTDASARPQADELVEKLQMGTPEEALAAVRQIVRAEVSEGRAQTSLVTAQQSIAREIESFGDANPDIAGNEDMAAAHRAILARHAANELRRVAPQLVSDAAYRELLNNPSLAGKAYATAIADGFQVRPVSDLLSESAKSVRQRFITSDSEDPPRRTDAPPVAHDRAAAKERLMQQPRSDAREQAPPPSVQRPARRSPSEVIAEMRRARHQV